MDKKIRLDNENNYVEQLITDNVMNKKILFDMQITTKQREFITFEQLTTHVQNDLSNSFHRQCDGQENEA